MTDESLEVGGNGSPARVAYDLMLLVAKAEKKKLSGPDANASRKWILETYSACRHTVAGRVSNTAPVKED